MNTMADTYQPVFNFLCFDIQQMNTMANTYQPVFDFFCFDIQRTNTMANTYQPVFDFFCFDIQRTNTMANTYQPVFDFLCFDFQLCIMMNNMAHVLNYLDFVPVPQALDFKTVLNNMIPLHGKDRIPQLEATLYNILECAKDDIQNKLEQIITHVGSRVN